ncbi:Uncharacterized conserved protein YtfP, gamma-glutamylcyclotransferase (GGCT)/AIG2-like family [Salinibacillus kushneri]|uniref:Gamma-glutamylcyclotransferase family protein n=1 Tax=Salinibacillus kushneri TaxID=237682 RepID=A0A1I0DT89_9BACI|nr:gamma-glutamylcyclotransferase family protein [Salinibacillus kushneri]SET35510.1 Uncharacterized conserved protein YtfP, gamma-glutamylcyclotransferase (GGCT)/AIG2-like family [Salinibacillus kushneri]
MTTMHHVFVYGTLRKHERNEHYLLGDNCIATQAWVLGNLYDTKRGYPAVIRNSHNRVYGEIYEVSSDKLKLLDQLEGYVGNERENHYNRDTAKVYTDQGSMNAIIYLYTEEQGEKLEKIDSGNWKCHRLLEHRNDFLYLAYGSCMDHERFQIAGVNHLFQEIMGCGIAKNFTLEYRIQRPDGGRADMVEVYDNDWVEGKVYKINQQALHYLMKREGVASGLYRPAFIDVEIEEVLYPDVLTFLVSNKESELAPPEHYAKEILRGAHPYVSRTYFNKLNDRLRSHFNMDIRME